MLKKQLQEDLKEALKNKEELWVSVLRMMLAVILNREKEKRYKLSKAHPEFDELELLSASQLIDEEVLEILFSEVKKRKEAALEFEKGRRDDLAEKEKAEAELIKEYLPKPFTEEEIRVLAKEIIRKMSVRQTKDIGRVMTILMPKVKGRAEGGTVSNIVKELLIAEEKKNIFGNR